MVVWPGQVHLLNCFWLFFWEHLHNSRVLISKVGDSNRDTVCNGSLAKWVQTDTPWTHRGLVWVLRSNNLNNLFSSVKWIMHACLVCQQSSTLVLHSRNLGFRQTDPLSCFYYHWKRILKCNQMPKAVGLNLKDNIKPNPKHLSWFDTINSSFRMFKFL